MWTIRVPSHSGDGPTLVAGQLRLPLPLPTEDPCIIRIVFYEDEESGQDEGETASADDVPKVVGNLGGGERSKLVTVEESKGKREWAVIELVSCRLVSRRMVLSSSGSRRFGLLRCRE